MVTLAGRLDNGASWYSSVVVLEGALFGPFPHQFNCEGLTDHSRARFGERLAVTLFRFRFGQFLVEVRNGNHCCGRLLVVVSVEVFPDGRSDRPEARVMKGGWSTVELEWRQAEAKNGPSPDFEGLTLKSISFK